MKNSHFKKEKILFFICCAILFIAFIWVFKYKIQNPENKITVGNLTNHFVVGVDTVRVVNGKVIKIK